MPKKTEAAQAAQEKREARKGDEAAKAMDDAKRIAAEEGKRTKEDKEKSKQGRLAPPDSKELDRLRNRVVDLMDELDEITDERASVSKDLRDTLKKYHKAKGDEPLK